MPKKQEKIQKGLPLKRIGVIGGSVISAIVFMITNIEKIEKVPKFLGDMFGRNKSSAQCHILEIATVPKFPYYLLNTLRRKPQDDFYWAVLKGNNKCGARQNIQIRFAVINKEVAQASDEPYKYTFEPGSSLTEHIDPFFKFNNSDIDTTLTFRWEIKDSTEKLIKCGTESIEVISKRFVDWDLKDPEGKSVPLEFLVASLSAWTLRPNDVVRSRAQEFVRETDFGIDPAESFRRWLGGVYSSLFHTEPRLGVHVLQRWFPRGEGTEIKQRIRTAAEILNAKNADSLEAALLIAALRNASSRTTRSRLVLFSLPIQLGRDKGSTQFLLSWSTNEQDWRAIDVTNPNKITFEQNETESSLKLNNLLQSRGDILAGLKGRGVFVDKEQLFMALDFDRAAKSFQVSGLP